MLIILLSPAIITIVSLLEPASEWAILTALSAVYHTVADKLTKSLVKVKINRNSKEDNFEPGHQQADFDLFWQNSLSAPLNSSINGNNNPQLSLSNCNQSTVNNRHKMVKTFQAYLPNCHRTYSCVHCRAHLANHDELISKVSLITVH